VLRSVDRDVEKSVGFKPVFMTSLDLGVSGSSTAIYSVAEDRDAVYDSCRSNSDCVGEWR
jgi:hypothetical protein